MPIRQLLRRTQQDVTAGRLLQCSIVVAVLTYLVESGPTSTEESRRVPLVLLEANCESVRLASDQCAFVQKHCIDFEAGLIPYLRFYYCALAPVKPLAVIILALWLAVLFATIGTAASDYFTPNLNTVARILGLSESVAGVTFLAFGNGSPDLFSTFASMRTNSGGLAIGELIGAAGFISSVVAGSMALVRPFNVPKYTFLRDVGYFAVSSCFCLVFLSDGLLQLWECLVMVGLYLSYVVVVVISHWFERKSQRHFAREAQSRNHFASALGPEGASSLESDREESSRTFADEYTSLLNSTEGALSREDASPMRSLSPDNLHEAALNESTENLPYPQVLPNSEREPPNPIRPSLVGALEFRAISWSLVRSRSQSSVSSSSFHGAHVSTVDQQIGDLESARQASPGLRKSRSLRTPSIGGHEDALLGTNVVEQRKRACSTGIPTAHKTRNRSLEIGGIELLGSPQDYALLSRQNNVPSIVLTDLGQEQNHVSGTTPEEAEAATNGTTFVSRSPLSDDAIPRKLDTEAGLLAPCPSGRGPNQRESHANDSSALSRRSQSFPHGSSSSESTPYERHGKTLRRASLNDAPSLPSDLTFPPTNTALPLREGRVLGAPGAILEPFSRPRWWPKRLVPPPRIFLLTLFPTFVHWTRKTTIERALALFTAPSVFLLTITLPVVDLDNTHELALRAIYEEALVARQADMFPSTADSWPHLEPYRDDPISRSPDACTDAIGPVIPGTPPQTKNSGFGSWQVPCCKAAPVPSRSIGRSWLLVIQIFTAPWFVALILWLNLGAAESLENLAIWTSCATILALLGLALSVVRVRKGKAFLPRPILCLMGFVVSVVWISMVAGEVVAVLKTIGLAFGISDALLGLTIFALGNSVGDLVANVTITRLGLPIMALSACFGGPLLNILLGVGLGGLYMTLRNHGDNVYAIHLGRSLFISGASLVATLVALLIAVPLNGWKMDRRLGWCLIGLWVLCTAANIALSFGGLMGPSKDA